MTGWSLPDVVVEELISRSAKEKWRDGSSVFIHSERQEE